MRVMRLVAPSDVPSRGGRRRLGLAKLSAAVLLFAGVPGCVERKERITVREDGTVHIVVRHESESIDDLVDGDALPDPAAGWVVDLRLEQQDDRSVHVHEAIAAFGPGAALPSRHGPPGDPLAGQMLAFPTTLVVEKRRDGVWWHFRRVYAPRRWAEWGALRESPAARRLEEFADLDVDATPEQIESLTRGVVDVFVERQLLLARRALVEAVPSAPQDGWLRVTVAMGRFGREMDAAPDVRDLLFAMKERDESKRGPAVTAAVRKLEARVETGLEEVVRIECGISGRDLSTFRAALRRQRKEAEVTEDLADDRFEIVVEMPGTIMGSNSDSLLGSSARWSFDGEDLFDRPRELLVSSRMAE